MRTPAVQTIVAQKLLVSVAKKTGTKISIGKFRYRFNKNLIIKDLFIADLNNDTLVFADKIIVNIEYLDIGTKVIALSSAEIQGLTSNIAQTDSNHFNFTFLIDSLKNKNKKEFDWDIRCNLLNIQKANIALDLQNKDPFVLDNFHFTSHQMIFSKHEASFIVNQLNFKIKDEFDLKDLAFSFQLHDNLISIRGFNLLTSKSHLNINKTKIIIPQKGSNKQTHFSVNIHSSKIFPHEFKLFMSQLENNYNNVQLTGKLSGDAVNLTGEKISFVIGDETTLNTDFILANLNNPEKIKYDITIHEVFTNKNSIEKIIAPFNKQSNLKLPVQLNKLGNLFYTGKLKGSLNKMTTTGSINCDIGLIETQLSLSKNNDKIMIDGQIKTMPIYLGSVLEDTTLGSLDIILKTEGHYSKSEGIDLFIEGGISSIEYKNIALDSINISGNIIDKSFYGRISSFDPKLRFDFEGLVNFDTIPEYKFKTNVYSCDLHSLGIEKIDATSDLSFNVNADFKGNSVINSEGSLTISDLFYFNDSTYFATDSILVKAITMDSSTKEIVLVSEFINGSLIGTIHPNLIVDGLQNIGNKILPSLIADNTKQDTISDFSFSIKADYLHPITEFLTPDIRISPGSEIYGNYHARKESLYLQLSSDRITYKNKALNKLNINCTSYKDTLTLLLKSKEFKYNNENSLKNFSVSSKIFNDNIENNFNWNNWLSNNYSGNISTRTVLSPNTEQNKPDFKLDIFPSTLVMNDTIWELDQSQIISDTSGVSFKNITIDSGTSTFKLNGKLSDNPNDSIDVFLKNVNLSHLNTLIKAKSLKFGGSVSGNSRIKDLRGEQKINFDLNIDDFTINNSPVGNTNLKSNWSIENKQLNILGVTTESKDTTFMFEGFISPSRKEINCNVIFDNYNLVLLEAFLKPTFSKVSGRGSGEILLAGKFPSPHWNGHLFIENTKLKVSSLKVTYTATDTIFVAENKILFNNIKVFDRDSNYASLNGNISHEAYKFFSYDIDIESKKILGIDTKYSDNPLYYGVGYGKGTVRIDGSATDLNIDIAATTLEKTKFTIPLEGKGELKDNEFITFFTPYANVNEQQEENEIITIEENNTNLNINLSVTPDAEILIIFDPQVGDMLKATGNAELTMEAKGNDFFMYGDYMIYKGDFIFTLQNVINKRLEIQPGSHVNWSGDPRDADIDLDAVYKIRRVSLGDLTQIEEDKTKKIPVNCHLLMTNTLQNPSIKFMVDVPVTTNNEAVEQINSLSEDEINKQVLSLLLVNKFTPLPGLIQTDNANTTTNLGATTASELLSNQLSSWMSQVTTEFDVGFSYRPGDDYSQQEVEFALSTTFWDDRIAVNGNFGYNGNQNDGQNTNTPYTTDFQVELKLNEKGNIRLNAFQKANNDYIYNGSAPYTQGLGIFYTEEFNDFDQLMMKMFRKNSAKKPEEPEVEVEMEKPTL